MAVTYKYIAQTSVAIKAPIEKVWEALTTPRLIQQYFMGIEIKTDWKVGSPISYRGKWEGKSFDDKGVIRKITPKKQLVVDYWSSFSGLPDRTENYQKVTYDVYQQNGGVGLTITQENIPDEESKAASEQNWIIVLSSLKKMLEK